MCVLCGVTNYGYSNHNLIVVGALVYMAALLFSVLL